MSICFPIERQLTRFQNNIFSQVLLVGFLAIVGGLELRFLLAGCKVFSGVVSDNLICRPNLERHWMHV